jgi:hypothetical protein
MRRAVLSQIDLPDFGSPEAEPGLSRGLYANRLETLAGRMRQHGLDAVVIYGDREHMANICWATGHDPRFEEALLVVVPGRRPTLFLGNEGFPYAEAAAGIFERSLWQPLSLMGQPRDRYEPLDPLLRAAGLGDGMKIGLAGWKGLETEAGEFDSQWFETPHYLVEALRGIGEVSNAAQLFMNPQSGLRSINEADQIACFEYAASKTSLALRRFIHGLRPGLSELEACGNMGLDGSMQSVHVNMSAGPRARYGLCSPGMRRIEPGDPIVLGFGLMGALNCRAGFVARDATGLPAGIHDYVDRLVAPYFEAAVQWYETIGIGVTGGAVYDAVMAKLGDPFFGISLNPGHLIHLDEWVHSPIRKASTIPLASGMALQCDIIPATGTAYFTTNIEDGIALADAALRDELADRFPGAWKRMTARRAFMIEQLGIRLKPEVLPLGNIPAWLPPFWLSPHMAMAMR